MKPLLRVRGILALILAACCLPVLAQEAPRPGAEPPPDWAKEDAAARQFALHFFRELRAAGSTDGLIDAYFDPDALSTYRKVAAGERGADNHSGCKLAPHVLDNLSDSMMRRKMVSELDIEYLEPLYLFAARRWTDETVAADFDVRSVFSKKLAAAEKQMEFFRFAPARNHCAVDTLETIGQLERSLDEAERAAALLRAALPPGLWSNPGFQKQLKAAQGDFPPGTEHSLQTGRLFFDVSVNALFSFSIVKQDGRYFIDSMSPTRADEFIRRKPTPGMEEAIAVADRFIARMHEELDLAKPMQELMVRNAVPRLRAHEALPFFFRYTMNSSFQDEMTDEEVAAVINESGDFLYLLFLHAAQVVKPGANNDSDFDEAFRALPPEVIDAGLKNPTVSFIFSGQGDSPDVKDEDELHAFLKDLRDINAVMRRNLPRDAFTGTNYRVALAQISRTTKNEVSTVDLSPDFPDPVEMYTLRREFFTLQIIREEGEMRIWKVDLAD